MATADRVGAEAAERILTAMHAAHVLQQDLADQSGIPRETLSRKLKRSPDTLTIRDIARIADALGLTFEELAFGTVAA
jgi:transcriptional regulator with XRE-family HTH domain